MRFKVLAYGLVIFSSLWFTPVNVIAGEEYMGEPYVGSENFQRLKSLAGRWEGENPKTEKPMVIEYRLTGGGSAIVETFDPGSPQEMVTIYHDKDESLSMTHYCMLGNRPEMDLTESNDSQLSFVLAKDAAIDVPNEPHMHALTITFQDDNKIDHAWTFFENGEEKEVHHITLSRVR